MLCFLTSLLLFLSFPVWADEDLSTKEIELSAECEPISTVADCVNVISGHFFQIDQDLVPNSIDPIAITRFYDSSSPVESGMGLGFGSHFPLYATSKQETNRHTYAMFSEREGFFIPFRTKEILHNSSSKNVLFIDPRVLEKGYSNLSRVEASGQANFVNWHAESSNDGWIVTLGDGTKRTYSSQREIIRDVRQKMGFPTKKIFLLTEEIKPNGNRLKFFYQTIEDKPLLSKVLTQNRKGETINEVALTHTPDECVIKSSCGHHVTYTKNDDITIIDSRPKGTKCLENVVSSQNGEKKYKSKRGINKHPTVYKIKCPKNHFLKAFYEDKKIDYLQEPVGPGGAIVSSYSFEYKNDKTIVKNALNQVTEYHFDKNKRLICIKSLQDDATVREQIFDWSAATGQQGWLLSKSLQLNGQIYHFTQYDYDSYGNIKSETVYGNITGEKSETFRRNKPDETDNYKIIYEYSQDGLNLLLSKKTPEGYVTKYEYLPNTNLRTKELHSYNGKIQERTFRTYDDNAQLKTLIEDDGSGNEVSDLIDVTYRRITSVETTEQNQKKASFGKPTKIVKQYYDPEEKHVIPLTTTILDYDDKGNLTSERILDANESFCFETYKGYDERDRLVKYINALGETTEYDYDENNNKKEERVLGAGKRTHYTYDPANRLIVKEEIYDDGQIFRTTYDYDALSRLVSEKDRYDNVTTYGYDRLGRQDSVTKPDMLLSNGNRAIPKIEKTYNLLDQVVTKTDENGFTTTYKYNIHGNPTLITHPDEAKEQYTYYPSGKLKQKIFADASYEFYIYDPAGKLIEKGFVDRFGNLRKKETYKYKGTLLKEKTDAAGLVTKYFYDGARRKVKEIVGMYDHVTEFAYDDFERVIKIVKKLNHNQGQVERLEYDWLNRVKKKTLSDTFDRLFAEEEYSYDIHGNKIEKAIKQSEEKSSVYKRHYNSDGTTDYIQDPFEFETHFFYNHKYINSLSQKVLSKEITDPKKRSILEVENANHQLVTQEIKSQGQLQSSLHYSYDLAGNPVRQLAYVIVEGKLIRQYGVEWQYNSRGQKSAEIEIPNGKTTKYAYNKLGKLKTKTLPNNTTLQYIYDDCHRVKEVISSDHTVHYVFDYDEHDNPIQIVDKAHNNITQIREYDLLNRLKEERLSPGVILKYEYDALDRMTKVTLPDRSYVIYDYDAFHLKHVSRYDFNDALTYQCECHNYDYQGNLLAINSAACHVMCDYDLLRRNTAIKVLQSITQKSLWESITEKYDPLGNLLKKKENDPTGLYQKEFSYDGLNQLTSDAENKYRYDSLGNCIQKNGETIAINEQNQLSKQPLSYDLNGNLKSDEHLQYTYDAFNRLVKVTGHNKETELVYDAFGRCLFIREGSQEKRLLYFDKQEVGSINNSGKLIEFRIVDPVMEHERTFAVELEGETYNCIQDNRHNICALQRLDGAIAKWYRYTAFGIESTHTNQHEIHNPWRFANRRELCGLVLYTHRLYHPELMRWLTPDPQGFEDGLNLYTYLHNNPYAYLDHDGLEAVFAITLFTVTLSAAPVVTFVSAGAVVVSLTYFGVSHLKDYLERRSLAKTEEAIRKDKEKKEESEKEQFIFPENPDDLLPELERDGKGRIRPGENIQIRPEQHTMKPGEKYNPRHHGQHYHVESRRDPSKPWKKCEGNDIEILKPPGYSPGSGTGFIPGEAFPGEIIGNQ